MIMLKSTHERLVHDLIAERDKWRDQALKSLDRLDLLGQDLENVKALNAKLHAMIPAEAEPEEPITENQELDLINAAIKLTYDSKPIRMADRAKKRADLARLSTQRQQILEKIGKQNRPAVAEAA